MPRAVMYNKKEPVIQVEMENGIVKEICECIDTAYLPIILQDNLTVQTLNDWLEKRKMPADREGMKSVITRFSYFHGYPDFDRYECMFSLSDQYWFRFDSSQSWEGMNYFTNSYSEDIGQAFFYPWELDKGHRFCASPDLTTNGALRKRWKMGENGESYLIKAGSKKLHQEPISEVLATILLRKLDIIPYVEYELTVEGMRLCSKCKNFVTKDTEFVPAMHIYAKKPRKVNESVYKHLLTMCHEYNIDDAKEYIDNMIAIDKILGNEDRHLGNFGFIRDVKSLEITGFAPLFDSGYTFLYTDMKRGENPVFSEKEKNKALLNMAWKIDKKKIQDHDEMFAMIEMYPEIDKIQKEYIKNRILTSEKEVLEFAKEYKKTHYVPANERT